MKSVKKKLGLFARLGVVSIVALISQQAMAAGTDPGTAVDNTVTVDFTVNSQVQPQISSNTASFVVDRRVEFSVTRLGSGLVTTTTGTTGLFVDFVVWNQSNGDLNFDLSVLQQDVGDGDIYGGGTEDTGVDMDNVVIQVNTNVDATPGTGDGAQAFVNANAIDPLVEDTSVRVRVLVDAPNAAPDNSIAGLELNATAADPVSDALLTASVTWNEGVVDNVFANASGADAGGNATESAVDGFLIQSAALTAAKSQVVISDPQSSGLAVPGAIIEYTIELTNAGSASADDIVLQDLIDSDVTLVTGSVTNGGSACNAVDNDLADGCAFDGTTLTVQGPAGSPISVAGGGGTYTVTFRVEIPATP